MNVILAILRAVSAVSYSVNLASDVIIAVPDVRNAGHPVGADALRNADAGPDPARGRRLQPAAHGRRLQERRAAAAQHLCHAAIARDGRTVQPDDPAGELVCGCRKFMKKTEGCWSVQSCSGFSVGANAICVDFSAILLRHSKWECFKGNRIVLFSV